MGVCAVSAPGRVCPVLPSVPVSASHSLGRRSRARTRRPTLSRYWKRCSTAGRSLSAALIAVGGARGRQSHRLPCRSAGSPGPPGGGAGAAPLRCSVRPRPGRLDTWGVVVVAERQRGTSTVPVGLCPETPDRSWLVLLGCLSWGVGWGRGAIRAGRIGRAGLCRILLRRPGRSSSRSADSVSGAGSSCVRCGGDRATTSRCRLRRRGCPGVGRGGGRSGKRKRPQRAVLDPDQDRRELLQLVGQGVHPGLPTFVVVGEKALPDVAQSAGPVGLFGGVFTQQLDGLGELLAEGTGLSVRHLQHDFSNTQAQTRDRWHTGAVRCARPARSSNRVPMQPWRAAN